MQTITAALKNNAAADSLGIEAWETAEGLEGILWDHGQERDSFTATGFDAITSAVIAAGFDYREVEHTTAIGTWTGPDWQTVSGDDDAESSILEITRA